MRTALKMIADGGFHSSPMSELAAVSGVAVGTIYHHFASKEDMILALYRECRENISRAALSGADSKLSVARRFDSLWRNLYSHLIKNPLEFSLIRQFNNSPLLSQLEKEGTGVFSKPVIDFFREGMKAGKLRKLKPEVLGEIFYSLVAAAAAMNTDGSGRVGKKDIDDLVGLTWSALKK